MRNRPQNTHGIVSTESFPDEVEFFWQIRLRFSLVIALRGCGGRELIGIHL